MRSVPNSKECTAAPQDHNGPIEHSIRRRSAHGHHVFRQRPVLYLVDAATRFSEAHFLPNVSTDSVWESIILCCPSVYTGLSNCFRIDERAQYRQKFADLWSLHDIQIKKSGIQSHNSLGVGEMYHIPLQNTYRKLKLVHPSLQRQVLLAAAVKAMNDILGPKRTVPSALIFREFPFLRSIDGPNILHPSPAAIGASIHGAAFSRSKC